MERFYKIALIIAVVFLILCLIGMGIILQYQNAGMKFPIHSNACPDLWDLSGNRCHVPKESVSDPSRNMGNITWSPDLSYSYAQMGGKDNICGQYKWATTHGINWDGVSNYNSC